MLIGYEENFKKVLDNFNYKSTTPRRALKKLIFPAATYNEALASYSLINQKMAQKSRRAVYVFF